MAGLLLAGGGSTRFGRDKAMVEFDGSTLAARGVACLRAACDGPVLVASGDGRRLAGLGDGQVADLVADGGPLTGIAAGLRALATADAVAVLAVDHPAPSAALLRLLAGARGAADAAVAVVAGRLQPLHAVWATAVADDLAAAVAAGARSPVQWLDGRASVVRVAERRLVGACIPPDATRDVDVPGDLARWVRADGSRARS